MVHSRSSARDVASPGTPSPVPWSSGSFVSPQRRAPLSPSAFRSPSPVRQSLAAGCVSPQRSAARLPLSPLSPSAANLRRVLADELPQVETKTKKRVKRVHWHAAVVGGGPGDQAKAPSGRQAVSNARRSRRRSFNPRNVRGPVPVRCVLSRCSR